MSQVSRSASKLKFETGDRPTQQDFTDFHDSVVWYDEKSTKAFRSVTTDNYEILSSDYVLSVGNGGGDWNILLPLPSTIGKTYIIKRGSDVDTGNIAVQCINAASIVQDEALQFVSYVTMGADLSKAFNIKRTFISNGTQWEYIP